MFRFLSTLFTVALLGAGAAYGQALVLKDGTRIPESDFKVEGGKIIRTIKIGDKSATTVLAKSLLRSTGAPAGCISTHPHLRTGHGISAQRPKAARATSQPRPEVRRCTPPDAISE